jgi:hydrogenase maturation protein HypF
VSPSAPRSPSTLRAGAFLDALARTAPGAAALSVAWGEPRGGEASFAIDTSLRHGPPGLPLAPDLATCADCLRDLGRPADRRHRYALLTCAACGPRFTIVRALPHGRDRTSMADFAPCARCRAEYADPADRRFHAETICPACGPALALCGGDGPVFIVGCEPTRARSRPRWAGSWRTATPRW